MNALDWRTVAFEDRRLWWERLWDDVCALGERYQLPVRHGWWEHPTQLEALAALAAWSHAYDDGDWDDPPGKLSLLLDLERIGTLLRDGSDPFFPDRDRPAFERHLIKVGCQPPAVKPPPPPQEA